MKRHQAPIAVLFLLILVTACAQPSRPDEAAIKAAILTVMRDQQAAWNAGDLEGFMAGYARSDSTRFVGGRGPTYGWETVLERYRKSYPGRAAMGRLKFSDLEITVIARDAALVFGKWALQREGDQPWGWYTLLFRKTAAGWRIVHDHTSSGVRD